MAQRLSTSTGRDQGMATVRRYLALGILGAALLVAVLASATVGRVFAPDKAATAADSAAPARSEACAYASGAGVPGEGCALARPGDGAVADTFDWEQWARTQTSPASPATDDGQRARLRAIEVRDNGDGTPDGDSGPCREPGRSCDH